MLPKPGRIAAPDYRQLIRDDLERSLSTAIEGIHRLDAEQMIVDGDPADVLAAHGVELDLLVIGSRGYGPLRRTLLGGVSAKVMRLAPCPVLVTSRGAGRLSGSPQSANAGVDARPQPR